MPDPGARSDRRFLFLVCSARREGNAELLARRAAAALPAEAVIEWLHLADFALPPFRDIRHSGGDGTYPAPEGDARALSDATLAASDLVFVAPVYWYGLPASGKLFLDHWSGWMRVPAMKFKARMAGKSLWAIASYSEDDPRLAAPLFETLRMTAAYMGMRFGPTLLGAGNRPGDVLSDRAAVAAAALLFAREPVLSQP